MPIINVTQADLMKIKNLDPGWYGCQVMRTTPLKTSAAGDSYNTSIEVLVLGDKANGKEISITLNSKLFGKLGPIWEAVTGKPFDPGQVDTDQLVGGKFDGKIGPRLHEGNVYDEIQAFLPFGKSKEATPF